MSPSQRRKQFVPARPRAEVFTAVAVGAGIVLGTALLIWLLRPGSPGVPGEGGLLSRQPRMTILLLLTAAAITGVVVFVLRRRHQPKIGEKGSIGLGVGLVIVLAVVAGIFWPGGVVRHWPKRPKAPVTNPTSIPATTATVSPGPGTTGKPGATVSSPTTVASSPTTKGG
jgi:hypothetical protein